MDFDRRGSTPPPVFFYPRSTHKIRVCEMCIKNDANVGRILHCGMCGVVACDEDCGPVMYECTGECRWDFQFFLTRGYRTELRTQLLFTLHLCPDSRTPPSALLLRDAKITRSGTTPAASSAAPSRTSPSSRSSGTDPPPCHSTACPAPPASASGASRPPRRG